MDTAGLNGVFYTLYYNRWSICSTMLRYLIEIRGEPKDEITRMDISTTEIDISHEEQFSEWFLCEINPKGQVPVLASSAVFDFPLSQTAAISKYITERYPELLPREYADKIGDMIYKLHDINFFSLSFIGNAAVASGLATAVTSRLENKTISDRYRKALEYKLEVIKSEKISGLEPEVKAAEIEKTVNYLNQVMLYIDPNGGPWLFGRQQPTELDTHLVVFLARLKDVGKIDLIPDALKTYLQRAISTASWHRVMEGRSTMFSVTQQE